MTYNPGAVLLLSAALGACSSTPARANGQAQFDSLLAKAKPGVTLTLPAGDYGEVLIKGRAFDKPVTVEAATARFTGLTLRGVQGLIIRGAQVTGSLDRNAILIAGSRAVSLENFNVSQARKGIVVDQSSDIVLRGNRLEGLRSDGINVALSQRVLIEGNQCRNFQPIPAIFDAAGKKVRDGDHPDCIQLWSRPTAPPVSDVLIRRNVADGNMQGIFLGNGQRNGLDDGGFDRVRIEDNDLTVAHPQGIGLYDARNSVVRNNRVRTVAGALLPNGKSVKGNVNIKRGSGNLVCGNIVAAVPNHPASERCPS